MDMDDLLHRYFGGNALENASRDVVQAGTERMQVDLGLETDRGRRFALWTFLYLLDAAPDLDATFEHPADRDAARNFMELSEEPPD